MAVIIPKQQKSTNEKHKDYCSNHNPDNANAPKPNGIESTNRNPMITNSTIKIYKPFEIFYENVKNIIHGKDVINSSLNLIKTPFLFTYDLGSVFGYFNFLAWTTELIKMSSSITSPIAATTSSLGLFLVSIELVKEINNFNQDDQFSQEPLLKMDIDKSDLPQIKNAICNFQEKYIKSLEYRITPIAAAEVSAKLNKISKTISTKTQIKDKELTKLKEELKDVIYVMKSQNKKMKTIRVLAMLPLMIFAAAMIINIISHASYGKYISKTKAFIIAISLIPTAYCLDLFKYSIAKGILNERGYKFNIKKGIILPINEKIDKTFIRKPKKVADFLNMQDVSFVLEKIKNTKDNILNKFNLLNSKKITFFPENSKNQETPKIAAT